MSEEKKTVEANILSILDAEVVKETAVVEMRQESPVVPEATEVHVSHDVTPAEEDRMIEKDFGHSQKGLDVLISAGEKAVEEMLALAQNSEQPRAYEVLATLINIVGGLNEKKIDLHYKKELTKKSRHSRTSGSPDAPNNQLNVNQANIYLSTAEIQDMLLGGARKKVVNGEDAE